MEAQGTGVEEGVAFLGGTDAMEGEVEGKGKAHLAH